MARACGQAWPSWASQVETGLVRLPWAMVVRWAEACGSDSRRLSWALMRAYDPDLHDALTARGRPRATGLSLPAVAAGPVEAPLLDAIAEAERAAALDEV